MHALHESAVKMQGLLQLFFQVRGYMYTVS